MAELRAYLRAFLLTRTDVSEIIRLLNRALNGDTDRFVTLLLAKLDPATIETLKTDAPLLTSILTYHVIPGQLSPDQVPGTHKTVEGQDVTITGAGEGLTFDKSALVCGGVQTANATVYMVDTVMMPPAAWIPAASLSAIGPS